MEVLHQEVLHAHGQFSPFSFGAKTFSKPLEKKSDQEPIADILLNDAKGAKTFEQELLIALKSFGISINKIIRETKISRRTIYLILNGKTRKPLQRTTEKLVSFYFRNTKNKIK